MLYNEIALTKWINYRAMSKKVDAIICTPPY